MTTYCMASAKGGSGKTILCACMGEFLATIGKKVLLVDVDYSTHGLTLLYLADVTRHGGAGSASGSGPRGLFDGDSFSHERDVVRLENEVDLFPATFDFKADYNVSDSIVLSALERVVAVAKAQAYDYVFLDAQAGGDIYSRIPMKSEISDEVIIVTEYDPLSAAGVERLRAAIGNDLASTRTWILVNKMIPDFVDSYSDFLEMMKYLSPIPWNADVVRAYARRELPLDVLSGNEFTVALMQTLKGLLDAKAVDQMDAWTAGQVARIREPIEAQYADVHEKIDALMNERRRKAGVSSASNFIMFSAAALTVVLGAAYVAQDALQLSGGTRTSIIVLLLSVVGALLMTAVIRARYGLDEMEETRILTQVDVLETESKRLDVLRRADAKTLMLHARRERKSRTRPAS